MRICMKNAAKGDDLKIAGELELNVLAKIKHHIREQEGLSQEAVAKKVGVSPSHFSQILGGVKAMKLSVILALIHEISLDPRILAPPWFYSDSIKKLKNQELFERICRKLQKLDALDDHFLGIVESYLDGVISSNKVHRTIQRQKRRQK